MGSEIVSGAAFCTDRNKRHPKHSGKRLPDIGTTVFYPALQLSVPDRMRLPEDETTDGCILLLFLIKTYAKIKLLPEER